MNYDLDENIKVPFDDKIIKGMDWYIVAEDDEMVAGDTYEFIIIDRTDDTELSREAGVKSLPDTTVTFSLNEAQTAAFTSNMNTLLIAYKNDERFIWNYLPIYDY